MRPEEAAEKGLEAVLSRDDIGRHLTSEMFFSGDRLPGFSDTIEHPEGLVLVDTGMIDTTRRSKTTARSGSGHTAGHQIVVVETDDGPVVLGCDVGHTFEELEHGETPGQQLVLELAAPTHLAHDAEVRVPHPRS